jgi:hypothetical protein
VSIVTCFQKVLLCFLWNKTDTRGLFFTGIVLFLFIWSTWRHLYHTRRVQITFRLLYIKTYKCLSSSVHIRRRNEIKIHYIYNIDRASKSIQTSLFASFSSCLTIGDKFPSFCTCQQKSSFFYTHNSATVRSKELMFYLTVGLSKRNNIFKKILQIIWAKQNIA